MIKITAIRKKESTKRVVLNTSIAPLLKSVS